MKLLSLNIGQPQQKTWNGTTVYTSIFKEPVKGKRKVSFLHIDGDGQADLRVHGGINKAVYAYDISHYYHWEKLLQEDEWECGQFGENLTTDGLKDEKVHIGDIYKIGTVKLRVVQPRFPCTKLNVRFARPDMMELFKRQRRAGIYFSVAEEGELEAGDEILLAEPSAYPVTIQQYVDCYYGKGADQDLVHTILSIPFLPESQRRAFESFQR